MQITVHIGAKQKVTFDVEWQKVAERRYEAEAAGCKLAVYWGTEDGYTGWIWQLFEPDGRENIGPADTLEEAQEEVVDLLKRLVIFGWVEV